MHYLSWFVCLINMKLGGRVYVGWLSKYSVVFGNVAIYSSIWAWCTSALYNSIHLNIWYISATLAYLQIYIIGGSTIIFNNALCSPNALHI